MAHVVVQLGVVGVDPQAGGEDGELVPPVLVPPVRLHAVTEQQEAETGVEGGRITPVGERRRSDQLELSFNVNYNCFCHHDRLPI